MAGAIGGATGSTANAASQLLSPTPKDIAAQLLSEHKAGRGYNMPELRRAYDQIAVNNPNQAQAVRGALDNMLSSRDRTAFAQAEYQIKAPDGGTLTIKEGAPSLAEYRASPKASDREHYLRLERNFGGDGLHRTNESAKVEANYFAYLRSGMGYEQFRAVQDTQTTAQANKDSAEFQALAGDLFQMGFDIGGIFDPTGALDAVSGGISLYKGEYFDAFMSGLALVPVIGGLAILSRLGKFGETINKAIDLAKSSPLARDMLMPALENIHGILNKIPAAALRVMPDSGRKALEGIKTRLDNVLDVGGRALDVKLAAAEDFAKSALSKAGISTPPSGTLSSVEARRWYLDQEVRIPQLLDKTAPVEQQAMQAWALRNEIRNSARDAMTNRSAADNLTKSDANLTWQQVFEKYGKDANGLPRSDEEVYTQIVAASQRSRSSVNESLGVPRRN